MGIKVVVKYNAFTQFAGILQLEAQRLAEVIAEQAAEKMVEVITGGQKSGEVYGGHQASAPGEAPANWEGDLVASIRADGSTVMADSDHAVALEYGTVHMEPRPFFWPSVEAVWKEEVDLFIGRIGATAADLGRT